MATTGYTDTPLIPNSQYRVHDPERPQPPVVTPGTPAGSGTPPSDAVCLFDGSSLDAWEGRDGPASWTLEDGCMRVLPGSGNIWTKKKFGSCQLHVEFREPSEVKGDGQGRGNSGIFLMRLYEIQVLDGYENPTCADGTLGAVYGQFPPRVNASRKPGEWQNYDILWEAPEFEGETLRKPAFVTVLLNGVLLHNHQELQGPTKHRETTSYVAHPAEAPLELQDHGDLVSYRNIWYRSLSTTS